MNLFKLSLEKLQLIGKSLMLPIAVLPIAALLLRFGQPDLLGQFSESFSFMSNAGGAIFTNLALIFAIGVAAGIAKDNHGAAALAGAIAFLVIEATYKSFNGDLNMGVLSGIIAGIIGGVVYNKYHDIKLPDFLAFFGGRRFVPIMSGLVALVLGVLFGFIWGVPQLMLDGVGNWIVDAGAFGAGVYGVLNRLLLPFGLHHILNTLVWFQFGEFTNVAGEIINGDLSRFFAGDPTAGKFMTGFFPIFMFGLPGAGLAFWYMAKKENKKEVAGVLISVVFTAFLTGITEPIEYLFMFIAPVLYLIHALIVGISMAVAYTLEYRTGFGFSAGFIDAALNAGISTNPWMIFILGPIFFLIYFFVFVGFIKIFNIPTLGRADREISLTLSKDDNFELAAIKFIEAFGGEKNIDTMDNCVTRLRLTLKDASLISDESAFKAIGGKAIIKMGTNSFQVVIGSQVESLANAIKARL